MDPCILYVQWCVMRELSKLTLKEEDEAEGGDGLGASRDLAEEDPNPVF